MDNKKVIILDFGYYMHKAIFAGFKIGQNAARLAMVMMIGDLKRFNCHPDDIILITGDSPKGSWRRDIDSNYKANRKANREKSNIDWTSAFKDFDKLKNILDVSTPFYYIEIDKLEADDLIAYACKYFKDTEVIISSIDSDFEQLAAYPNVKLFSPLKKKFKEVKNPYAILTKKLAKETSDNLTTEVTNEIEFKKRHTIVNLLQLPTDIEISVKNKLDSINYNKLFNTSLLPYPSLRERIIDIYNTKTKLKEKKKGKNKELKI